MSVITLRSSCPNSNDILDATPENVPIRYVATLLNVFPSLYHRLGELFRHTRYMLTREKPHKYTICNYASVEKNKLCHHMRIHAEERPHEVFHETIIFHASFQIRRRQL